MSYEANIALNIGFKKDHHLKEKFQAKLNHEFTCLYLYVTYIMD